MRYLLVLLILFGNTSLHAQSMRQVLQQLDDAVRNRDELLKQHEAHLDTLKHCFYNAQGQELVDLGGLIYHGYESFNLDSAYHYCNLCIKVLECNPQMEQPRQLMQIWQAQCLIPMGLYADARQQLQSVRSHLFPQNSYDYYRAMYQFYLWSYEFSSVRDNITTLSSLVCCYRDSMVLKEPDPDWRLLEQALDVAENHQPARAMNMIRGTLDTLTVRHNAMRHFANTMAAFYERQGVPDSALYYYALSATADLYHGVTEYTSLRKAALLLFHLDDVSRAYRYINCCMEDANYSRARQRSLQMASDMPAILDAYQHQLQHTHTLFLIAMGILVALLIVLGISLYRTFRISQHLSASRQLERQTRILVEQTNRQLTQANHIQETYVTQYMTECSEWLTKMDNFRRKLLKYALAGDQKKLLQTIKSPNIEDDEIKKFFEHFDETFLGLFPHFVQDLNSLLRPEERFTDFDGRHLTTELRIFALIRLGITNSDAIALFLHHSIKTIYNYRARMRNKALGNRDTLEQDLCSMG